MSSDSDTSENKVDDSNEKGIRRTAISEIEIQPIKYSDSPNFYDSNDEYLRTSPKIQREMSGYNKFSSTDDFGFNAIENIHSSPINFHTRLDFGTGFNMRITSKGTDNLNQSTTLISETPTLKNVRLIDAPLNLIQRTIMSLQPKSKQSPRKTLDLHSPTVTQPFETPQLSYGTYGWARVPHTKIHISPISSKKKMHIHDKKKTIPTPIRRLGNVRTYRESPPPITISKDRRPRGIFSPRSIYKRQLISRKNLFGNESSRGSGTWHDYSNQDKSSEISDRSLSWETPEKFEPSRYGRSSQPRSTISSKSSSGSRTNYSPTSQIASNSPRSSLQSTGEELDWSGLFSPEITDSSPNQIQIIFEPNGRKRYVTQSVGTKRYFQPSKGFIPRTL